MANTKVLFLSSLLVLSIPGVVTAADVGAGSFLDTLPLSLLMVLEFALTAFVGISLFVLFPDWSHQAARTARYSPVFSLVFGVLAIIGIWMLQFIGGLLTVTIIGAIVGLPLIVIAIAVEVIWTTVGFVVVGTVIANRLIADNVWIGIFAGSLLSALIVPIPYLGTAIGLAIGVLGIGAAARVTLGPGGVSSRPSERSVPPAHRT
ncbi:hypothetical protein AB7C87_05965 [Natrarchaeobius sp. A-rgal3]|uniref:hypothetical protein n=1 Tax=Natrarchaeobius versutus TaxID=1679078 RepID=UPI003510C66C